MSYLTEAFKQLNIIDEDLFPTDSEGLNKLKDFMKSDIDDEDLVVYDETANNEDEIKDSYNGKVILRCNVCKSHFFKEPKSVIIDAEAGLANVGDECCYCHNDMGYNVVGVVAPYATDVSKEERAEVAHENNSEVNTVNESTDRSFNFSCDMPENLVKHLNKHTVYVEDVEDKIKSFEIPGVGRLGDNCDNVKIGLGIKLSGLTKEAYDWADEELYKELEIYADDLDYAVNESVKRINESDITVGAVTDQLNKCYGECNVAFKYDSGEEAEDFHKVVMNWANKNRKHFIELRATTLEAGDIDLDDVKTNGGRSIIFIEDIDRISDDVRHDIGELVRDMKGHVVATAYNKSKVDQAIASRFVWLSSVNESVKRINEETNYDKVMRVLNNMKKEEPIRESLDDINKKLDRSYGRFNLGFVYSLNDPLAFEKAVIEWAKAKSLYVFRTNGYVVSEDFVPGIDSTTGKRIEPDMLKQFNRADIIFIDNYNTVSKEAMPYVIDYVKERQGHVIVTVPEGKMSSLDAAATGRFIWIYDNDLKESVKKIDEDLKDVSITTDDTKIQMTAEENGKVTVTTEPVKNEMNIEDTEVIKPLSAADKDIIANNGGEDGEEVLDDEAIDFDEINDKDLDKLGEKYFTKVYDNVKSFKSTACKLNESGVILEGKITFKSGKEAKTAFNFNEAYVTKTGKVKLIGENAQFAKNKKAFTLTGSLNNKKLVVESFTYNYRTKDEKTGKSTRLYGTVSK